MCRINRQGLQQEMGGIAAAAHFPAANFAAAPAAVQQPNGVAGGPQQPIFGQQFHQFQQQQFQPPPGQNPPGQYQLDPPPPSPAQVPPFLRLCSCVPASLHLHACSTLQRHFLSVRTA